MRRNCDNRAFDPGVSRLDYNPLYDVVWYYSETLVVQRVLCTERIYAHTVHARRVQPVPGV